MRAVAFRDQAWKIMGISSEEFEKFSDNLDAFNEAKNNVLGNQMVLSGKVTSNEMYNRKEFMVRNVHEMKAEEILDKYLN
jgi:7-cyano-7-deazaguanine synthase in queuosine biosynthesis